MTPDHSTNEARAAILRDYAARLRLGEPDADTPILAALLEQRALRIQAGKQDHSAFAGGELGIALHGDR